MSFLSGDVNQKHLTSEIVLPGAHDVRHKADTCISEMCFVSVQQIDLQEDTEFGGFGRIDLTYGGQMFIFVV